MMIFDRSLLALPFYDDAHRALADRLESWVADRESLCRDHAGLDPAERGRLYTRLLGEDGWLAHVIPEADGGRARPDLRSLCLMREAFAYLDDLMDFALAIQGLAAAPVAWYGSDAQRAAVLPGLRAGRTIGSLALSEPATGSNLAAVGLEARREGDGYRLHGEKTWVSNGTIADHHAVLARTGEGPGGLGLSFLMVPADAPGLSVTPIGLMAPRSFAGLTLDGVGLADGALPGGALVGRGGMGFKYAMDILNFYRVTVGAAAIGFARKAYHAAVGWCRDRDIGGTRLIEAQMTRSTLANMAVFLDSASLLVVRAAWEFDTGRKDTAVHASMAKLHATDGAARVIDDAVQLLGAAGLVTGSVTEELYRQIRALRIYEGTSEIQKLIISGAATRRSS